MAMFRLTSSKVVPYAVRAILSRATLSGSITNAIKGCDQSFGICHQHYSTDAKKQIDDKLVKIIKSEIKLTQRFVQRDDMPSNPHESPFTFEDNPWDKHVTLSRDSDGEKIDVVVTMPYYYGTGTLEDYDVEIVSSSDSDVSDDISSSDSADWFRRLNLLLEVKVSKKNGKISEFNVLTYADGETRVREYSLLKEAEAEAESETSQPMRRFGPHPVKKGSDLENALLEFVKLRGIKRSNYVFLFDYMLKKHQRSPVVTLKELKQIIEH